MACQCTTLLPEQIIEAFNDVLKQWQICSIASIQTNHGPSHQTQLFCNTVFAVNVINTTDTIQSISCNDFNKKWRFVSPSKLAHAPRPATETNNICSPSTNQLNRTAQRKKLTQHADDVSSEEEEDALRNATRKRKFVQFATNSVTECRNHKSVNNDNTNNKSSTSDNNTASNMNTDTASISQRVSKRRRLNNSQHACAPKSFLSMTRLKKKAPKPPIIMIGKTPSNNGTNTNSHNHVEHMNKAQRTQKERIAPTAKPTVKPPAKPPPPIIMRTPAVSFDDEGCFDKLDEFRSQHEDKFPALETIETLCRVRRYDAKKMALRYFECRDSALEYILMETNEYRCTKCHQMYNNDGLGVDSLTKIKTHVILHTDNAFKCPVCDKPFVNQHHLMYHIRQKKDAKNAHKQYYLQHYAATDRVATKPKRVRKKAAKPKKRTENVRKQPVNEYHMNFNGLPNLNYHDYNSNKNAHHIPATNGPPPLSPVPNEEDADNEPEALQLTAPVQQQSDALPPPSPPPPRSDSNTVVQYTSPPSPYDVAPLPISTTNAGEEMMSFRILDVERREEEYPPVPLAPN